MRASSHPETLSMADAERLETTGTEIDVAAPELSSKLLIPDLAQSSGAMRTERCDLAVPFQFDHVPSFPVPTGNEALSTEAIMKPP